MLEEGRGRDALPKNLWALKDALWSTIRSILLCHYSFAFSPHPIPGLPEVDQSLFWPEDISGDICCPQELFRWMRDTGFLPSTQVTALWRCLKCPPILFLPPFLSVPSVRPPLGPAVFPSLTGCSPGQNQANNNNSNLLGAYCVLGPP